MKIATGIYFALAGLMWLLLGIGATLGGGLMAGSSDFLSEQVSSAVAQAHTSAFSKGDSLNTDGLDDQTLEFIARKVWGPDYTSDKKNLDFAKSNTHVEFEQKEFQSELESLGTKTLIFGILHLIGGLVILGGAVCLFASIKPIVVQVAGGTMLAGALLSICFGMGSLFTPLSIIFGLAAVKPAE